MGESGQTLHRQGQWSSVLKSSTGRRGGAKKQKGRRRQANPNRGKAKGKTPEGRAQCGSRIRTCLAIKMSWVALSKSHSEGMAGTRAQPGCDEEGCHFALERRQRKNTKTSMCLWMPVYWRHCASSPSSLVLLPQLSF